MNREQWIGLLDRWLRIYEPAEYGNISHQIPPGTPVWTPSPVARSAEPGSSGLILVAMLPRAGDPNGPDDFIRHQSAVATATAVSGHERVHRGRYIAADRDACVLFGEDGIYFVPWAQITWIRG